MSEYLEKLIFDRTQADLEKLTNKAYISYLDLNRIELAIKYVALLLNEKGYRCKAECKLNWKPADQRLESEMVRIRNNLEVMRTAFFAGRDTPLTPARITYESIYQANAIEKIIFDIGNLIEKAFPAQNRLAFKLGTRSFGDRTGGA